MANQCAMAGTACQTWSVDLASSLFKGKYLSQRRNHERIMFNAVTQKTRIDVEWTEELILKQKAGPDGLFRRARIRLDEAAMKMSNIQRHIVF